MKIKEIKILAGITQNDELYFLEINPMESGNNHFSMSGSTVAPITLDEAKEEVRSILEDGEGWRGAVEDNQTTLGLEDWVDWVLRVDGELAGFDNSLFDEQVEVDGQEYIFRSESCGQHEEENLKHYFIPQQSFEELMKAWKKWHLKEVDLKQAGIFHLLAELPEQNITDLAKQAISIIKN